MHMQLPVLLAETDYYLPAIWFLGPVSFAERLLEVLSRL